MTPIFKFEGIYTPVVTPHFADGSVNFDTLANVIDHLIYRGVHGLISGGSTGENYAQTVAERIEIARGPQGALYGKSTIAGALSVISARPTDEFDSYLRASYEFENDGPAISGMISGPIAEGLRGRLVASYEETDGYIKNTLLDTDEPESEKFAARGILEWDISDTMTGMVMEEHVVKVITGWTTIMVSPGLFGGLTADPDA